MVAMLNYFKLVQSSWVERKDCARTRSACMI
jgi:hypothetical protein